MVQGEGQLAQERSAKVFFPSRGKLKLFAMHVSARGGTVQAPSASVQARRDGFFVVVTSKEPWLCRAVKAGEMTFGEGIDATTVKVRKFRVAPRAKPVETTPRDETQQQEQPMRPAARVGCDGLGDLLKTLSDECALVRHHLELLEGRLHSAMVMKIAAVGEPRSYRDVVQKGAHREGGAASRSVQEEIVDDRSCLHFTTLSHRSGVSQSSGVTKVTEECQGSCMQRQVPMVYKRMKDGEGVERLDTAQEDLLRESQRNVAPTLSRVRYEPTRKNHNYGDAEEQLGGETLKGDGAAVTATKEEQLGREMLEGEQLADTGGKVKSWVIQFGLVQFDSDFVVLSEIPVQELARKVLKRAEGPTMNWWIGVVKAAPHHHGGVFSLDPYRGQKGKRLIAIVRKGEDRFWHDSLIKGSSVSAVWCEEGLTQGAPWTFWCLRMHELVKRDLLAECRLVWNREMTEEVAFPTQNVGGKEASGRTGEQVKVSGEVYLTESDVTGQERSRSNSQDYGRDGSSEEAEGARMARGGAFVGDRLGVDNQHIGQDGSSEEGAAWNLDD